VKSKKYLLLTFIYVFTILLTIYFCRIYKNSITNVDDSSIGNLITDVTGSSYDMLYNNISNYNKENHNYVIYVASYKYFDLSNFENKFRKVIIDNNVKSVIYINADELKKYEYLNRLISDFSDSDFSSVNISDLPVFIYFKNEKIVNIVRVEEMDEISLFNALEEIYD